MQSKYTHHKVLFINTNLQTSLKKKVMFTSAINTFSFTCEHFFIFILLTVTLGYL